MENITLQEKPNYIKNKRIILKNIIQTSMDLFSEPKHKLHETDRNDVNIDLVGDGNNLYLWAVQEYSMTSYQMKKDFPAYSLTIHPCVLIVKMIPLVTLFMFSSFAVSHKTWEVGC